MRWLVAILVLLAVLFLIGYFRIDSGVMIPGQTVLEGTLQWVQHATGAIVAAVAGLLILLGAVQGERVETVVSLTLPLFAGLSLLNPDWPAMLGLASVAVGLVVREALNRRTARETRDSD